MSQVVWTLPRTANPTPEAERYITEGFEAHQHCTGRGGNPHDYDTPAGQWWDEGWCEAELCDLPPDRREAMERYLAGGNE